MAAAAPVGDGVVPFEGAYTILSAMCVPGAPLLCCGMMCSNNELTLFLPASDDSDSDEGNQGRTMATEYELAPLEGAAISPVSFQPCSPSFALLSP